MAVNQQLKNYIDQQVKLGVSNDIIKSALLGAGWQESDIDQAMASFASSVGAAAVKQVEMAKPAEIKPIEIKPIRLEIKSSDTPLPKFSPSSGPQKEPAPVSFVTSDIFQPKNEPMFESKWTVAQTSLPVDKPQAVSTVKGMNFFQKPIAPIALGALSVILLVGAGILYTQNSSLQTKVNSANQENVSLKVQLDSFTSDKNTLANQITSFNQTISDLNNQLSLYAVPANASKTQELPITIKGVLGGGGKSVYFLTTNKDIIVTVKNSSDPRVDGVLKPFLGNQVEISGTHLLRSDFVTVTTVNGTPLASLQPTSTSTPKAATSTSTNTSQ